MRAPMLRLVSSNGPQLMINLTLASTIHCCHDDHDNFDIMIILIIMIIMNNMTLASTIHCCDDDQDNFDHYDHHVQSHLGKHYSLV